MNMTLPRSSRQSFSQESDFSRSPIAEVVFNLPLEKSFHYAIPTALRDTLVPGMRVAAPFGHKELIGFVTQRLSRSPFPKLKSIRRVIDPIPVVADERWDLAQWLSDYYYCSLGEALSVLVPGALRLKVQEKAPTQSAAALESPLRLNAEQSRAFEHLKKALGAGKSETFLLHGVTGSGKTELYLQAIAEELKQGRGAICLVPEIAITPQTIDRFRRRFGDNVVVWHSRLTQRQRAQAWWRVSQGQCRVVVGTRSALFLPVSHLGLVILDEEHETSYKQEDVPRYHARDVAKARARLIGAVCLLGSATPSMESYFEARQKKNHLLCLSHRVSGRTLPKIDVVDMREELAHGKRSAVFSTRLRLALEQTVERGEQAMLLLNRRGFARVAQCSSCGDVVRCPRCAVPLVYHAVSKALVCHYCNAKEAVAEFCQACRKGVLRFRGMGTEKVESEVHRLFPAANIRRMDADTMKGRGAHQELYEALREARVGVLVGTQMIAKGHDFPQVTFVGVISADTALNLPDFRAGERTFGLLTQMAGRAGRGERPGRVLIQTYCPQHYAIQAAIRHDYEGFYEEEMAMRRRVGLPPWTHFIELMVRGSSRERAQDTAEALASTLRQKLEKGIIKGLTLLGPAPHRIPKLRRSYRMSLILSANDVEAMVKLLRQTLQSGRRFRGLPVIVNVDPQ